MNTKINLSRSDIDQIVEVLDLYEIQHFKLIREDGSGIGYTLELEFDHKLKDNLITSRIEIVGPGDW